MVANDDKEHLKRALIKFINTFEEYGYGEFSDWSYPAEWDDLISIARRERENDKNF